MSDEAPVKRWTAKRKSAVVIDIFKGEITSVEVARQHDLTVAEVERWATDICHVWCGRDRRGALAAVIDCCTREILGWRLSSSGATATAEAVLEETLISRLGHLQRFERPLMLRSDNGLVFSSKHYTNTVRAYGLTQEFIM